MSSSGEESSEVDQNLPTDVTQVSTVVQGLDESQASWNPAQVLNPVPTNVFTRTLHGTLVFTTAHVKSLVEEVYGTQDVVLYW